MAIWNSKKNKKSSVSGEKPEKAKTMEKKPSPIVLGGAVSSVKDVLTRPRITEKASISSSKNAYVFDVLPRANKKEVAVAIFKKYGFKPVKVNITTVKEKKILSRRGTSGIKSGGKKAVVYLKSGDKIETI